MSFWHYLLFCLGSSTSFYMQKIIFYMYMNKTQFLNCDYNLLNSIWRWLEWKMIICVIARTWNNFNFYTNLLRHFNYTVFKYFYPDNTITFQKRSTNIFQEFYIFSKNMDKCKRRSRNICSMFNWDSFRNYINKKVIIKFSQNML